VDAVVRSVDRREFLALLAAAVVLPGQTPKPVDLPPVSWTCPMHAEVVDNKSGKCPICKMDLVPVRLDLIWSCTNHIEVTQLAEGRCPICRRPLVRVVKALTFTCKVHPKVDELNPGKCPKCNRTLVAKHSLRPHGDHNPKHGGQFFMASNNWHLEVTHPSAALFRLYVYDEYSRPFAPKALAARIVEVPGANGRPSSVSVPFVRSGPFLDARVPGLGAPATIAVMIRFESGDKEYRFDLPFLEFSKEPK